VYGLAIYCPSCGQLAPAQQFVELVRVQRDRLAALDGLDAQTRRNLVEAGVVTSIYESTFKDGFGALETYLKDRFQQDAKNLTKPRPRPPSSGCWTPTSSTSSTWASTWRRPSDPRCGRCCCRRPPSATC